MVKREVRVLGLTIRKLEGEAVVVGIVFRGGLWFDGILYGRFKEAEMLKAICEMVEKSPHRGQIRVIILDDKASQILSLEGLRKLSEILDLPVLSVKDRRAVWFSGVGCNAAAELLEKVSPKGEPEALRVARIAADRIVEQLTFKS